MAEIVEIRSEQMIPELERMEKMEIFDRSEIKAIIKKKEDFEHKLGRQAKSKEDILRYIQYEMDLLKLIRQKRNEKGLTQKSNSKIDVVIINHIDQLYNYAIRMLPEEVKIWLSYIKFCTQVRFHPRASKVLELMLKLHQNKPSLFKVAAHWEFEESNCIERARKFLLNGLHIHKDSKLLYKDAFLLELNYAQQKRKEVMEAGDTVDENDSVLSGRAALVIYESAAKQISDVDFVVELLKVTSDYPFTKDLQKKILEDLSSNFPTEELTWDTLAKRELESGGQALDTSDTAKVSLKERINNCCKVYEAAVRQLNTERMWAMYIEKMLDLYKETSSLPNMLKNCLKKAFNGAHSKGMMSEKYYLLWVEHLKSSGRGDIYDVLLKGTEKLPGSVTLWGARLRYHLTKGEEEPAIRVFRESLAGLGDASLPVWKLMLQYYQNDNPTKAEDLFREGTVLTSGISSALKPLYLEWLTLSRGIVAARKAYASMAQTVPFCLEMHMKMAELEDIQPTLSLKYARKVHQFTCMQFGSRNTDVWMNYVKFEQTHGNAELIPDIYNKAVKLLQPNLVDFFVSEYSLSKAESFSSHTPAHATGVHLPKYDQVEETMDTS